MAKAINVTDIIKFANQVTLEKGESIMDYPGGLTVITNTFQVEQKNERETEGNVATEECSETFKVTGFEDGGTGSQLQLFSSLIKLEKEDDSLLDPPETNTALLTH